MKRNPLSWAWNPEAFASRCYRAAIERDWQFLLKASDILKPSKPPKRFPLHLKVQAAYENLYQRHGWAKTTKELIRQTVDPTIALKHYARAFKEVGLQNIPEGKRGPKPKLIVPKKDF